MRPEPKEMFLSRTTCDLQQMTVDSDGCVDAFMISVTLLTICSAMCLPDGQVGRAGHRAASPLRDRPAEGDQLLSDWPSTFFIGMLDKDREVEDKDQVLCC